MAAGLGYKEFTTGDVLTAADANGYLASQVVMVFASAAARTSAIASPQEGMISYLKDTNSTEYYSGSAWVAIGAAAGGGMTVLASGTLSGSALDLTSINQTYTNLVLEITDANWNTSNDYLKIRFNNLSTSIYTSVAQGTNDRGGAASFYGAGDVDRFIVWGGVTLLRTGKNSLYLTIPSYTQTKGRRNMFGTLIAQNSTPNDTLVYWNGYSTDTAAISRITFSTQDGHTFNSGSYTLWGVK
jgi:hypothetical protein